MTQPAMTGEEVLALFDQLRDRHGINRLGEVRLSDIRTAVAALLAEVETLRKARSTLIQWKGDIDQRRIALRLPFPEDYDQSSRYAVQSLLLAEHEWRPIDTVIGSPVLVCGGYWYSDGAGCSDGGRYKLTEPVIAYKCSNGWHIGYGEAYNEEHWAEPTHWQPLPSSTLPPPPKAT
jgi:hypothetical protein